MVENERDPDRLDKNTGNPDVPEADPTLDIVRQLIEQAEALPALARKPSGPPTPRPAKGTVLPERAAAKPAVAPVDAPSPVPDALPEDWDDDPENDGWDAPADAGGVRPYRIVDVETGEVVAPDGASAHEKGFAAGPADAQQARPPVLPPWIGNALCGLGAIIAATLLGLAAIAVRMLLALGRWTWARLVAASRVLARFLRRPDAPRRLGVSLLVIFVIAWPVKVLWLTLLIPLAALITWSSVGTEGCAALIVGWHNRLKARDPDKAERIRLRAAAISRGLGRGLDRLPERWTQGLYLPDFEPEGYVPEKLRVDPFEELAAKVHSAKRAGRG